MHAKGVALREGLVRKQVHVMRELGDMENLNRLYQALTDIVLEVSPDLQKRLIARFIELKNSRTSERQTAAKDATAPGKSLK